MGSVMSICACKKCAGVYEEVFYYKEGRSAGFCNRCGYSESESPSPNQTAATIQAHGWKMDVVRTGGYGILSFAGESHFLDDDTPETLRKARQILDDYAEEGSVQFLTAWVDGTLVCLEGTMPLSFAEMDAQAGAEDTVPAGVYAMDGLPF